MAVSAEGVVAVEVKNERNGARNLTILAVVAVIVAMTTTAVGVYLYVSSGDIFLDRSLPGLLPEVSEQEEDREEQYVFGDSGPINKGVVDEFLRYFDDAKEEIEGFSEPFSERPLADDTLIFVSSEQGED